ncbi:MAG: DMT family transporter, partial [Bdellovibrionales bacterium]|nr:DMT family transporter [Bdellovibrionales bacterium]
MKSNVISLLLGASIIGSAAPLAKLSNTPPNWVGILRCTFAGIALLILIFIQEKGAFSKVINRLSAPGISWLAFTGGVFGVDMFVWHKAIYNAGAGLSTVLGNTQVFYLTIVGLVVNKEKVRGQFWLALIVAIAGVYFLVGDIEVEGYPRYPFGVLCGLLTGVCYATFTYSLSRSKEKTKGLDPFGRLFIIMVGAAFTLWTLNAAEGIVHATSILPPHLPIESIGWLVALAILPQIGGWYL